jgi:hypothetical protein
MWGVLQETPPKGEAKRGSLTGPAKQIGKSIKVSKSPCQVFFQVFRRCRRSWWGRKEDPVYAPCRVPYTAYAARANEVLIFILWSKTGPQRLRALWLRA